MFFLDTEKGHFKRQRQCRCDEDCQQVLRVKLAEFPTHNRKLKRFLTQIAVPCSLIGVLCTAYTTVTKFTAPFSVVTIILSFVGILGGIGAQLGAEFLDKYWHRFVQVNYECEVCSYRFAITYDVNEEGKRKRCGSYTMRRRRRLTSTSQLGQKQRSLRNVNELFSKMTETIGALNFSCKDWANELYKKITN
ncbi:hypothetical protein M3Y97_00139000 [Aphelenchoides bicaudatus]|nr:hypothetical protein M3Y97_00139000 [Aphelenchoides bicaudatus]